MALKAGHRGPRLESAWLRWDYWQRRTRRGCVVDGLGSFGISLCAEQPLQNWRGQGESDCLIKTKHCDGLKRC